MFFTKKITQQIVKSILTLEHARYLANYSGLTVVNMPAFLQYSMIYAVCKEACVCMFVATRKVTHSSNLDVKSLSSAGNISKQAPMDKACPSGDTSRTLKPQSHQ